VVSNASTTSPAAMASGDVDAASHSPLDLLIRFHSCLVLDAGFNHQMQSNPGMPMSEDEYGHHHCPPPSTVTFIRAGTRPDHVTWRTCIQSNMRQKPPNAG
jgi:hypothetical protein